jgi:hypothetical protein
MPVNPGEVEIELNGRREVLRPTLRAAKEVNLLGGIAGAITKLASGDLEAYITVVCAGLKKRRTDIEDDVWATGMEPLAEPLSRFVSILGNGGKEPKRNEGEPREGEA